MSLWASTHEYLDNTFEEICKNCGQKNKVEVSKQEGHNEPEEYYCANCRKQMGAVSASNTPKTTIVK